jgi:3-phenylpropionate/cinnamic acid dioxygenase small subunit
VEEVHLLDSGRFDDWLGLLHPDIRYRMPVRVTTARAHDDPVLGAMDHLDEDLHSLTKRVQRLASDTAWTEDPPSRLRHLVTNVRTFAAGTTSDGSTGSPTPEGSPGALVVESYVLLFRSRLDTRAPDLVSAGRRDLLVPAPRTLGGESNGDDPDGERWLLAERLVEVDEAVLRTQNLAIFL